jgi:hypothetical protein
MGPSFDPPTTLFSYQIQSFSESSEAYPALGSEVATCRRDVHQRLIYGGLIFCVTIEDAPLRVRRLRLGPNVLQRPVLLGSPRFVDSQRHGEVDWARAKRARSIDAFSKVSHLVCGRRSSGGSIVPSSARKAMTQTIRGSVAIELASVTLAASPSPADSEFPVLALFLDHGVAIKVIV